MATSTLRWIMIVAAALATGNSVEASEKPVLSGEVFRNLPGVVPPSISPQSGYHCTTATRPTRRHDDSDLFGDEGLPVLVYRCERDGVVFESTRPPRTADWYPGVNPRIIPERD